MPAAERDLYIEAETTWRMRFTWCQPREQDSDPLIPYSLAGATAFMHLRQRYGSPILVSLDSIGVEGGITLEPSEVIAGSDGKPKRVLFRGCIEVRMRPEQTAAIAARRGRYDILVQMPGRYSENPQDVETHRILQGAFELSRAITIPVPVPAKLVAQVVTLPSAPTTPLVDLSWSAVPSASFYEVLRNGLIIAGTTGANIRSLRDAAPPVGSNIYTLRAHNVFGQSTDSDPVPVEIEAPVVVVPDPTEPTDPADPTTPVDPTDPSTDPSTPLDPDPTPVTTPVTDPVVTP